MAFEALFNRASESGVQCADLMNRHRRRAWGDDEIVRACAKAFRHASPLLFCGLPPVVIAVVAAAAKKSFDQSFAERLRELSLELPK